MSLTLIEEPIEGAEVEQSEVYTLGKCDGRIAIALDTEDGNQVALLLDRPQFTEFLALLTDVAARLGYLH